MTLINKNIFFYSLNPNDQLSREFMQELDKNPGLKRQFITVCVDDQRIRIPSKIRQLGRIPVLVVTGLDHPILGNDAIGWLKNGSFQEKANGFEYGSFNDDPAKFAFLTDESKPSDYNQHFNSDYNHGFTDREGVLNQQFTTLKNDTHITTYDDSNEMKNDIKDQLERRLTEIQQQRSTDVPKPIIRYGGLEPNSFNGSGTSNMGGGGKGNDGGAPTYNPNPFSSQGHQLPFAMPPSPNPMSYGGPQGPKGPQGPRLPFNMPKISPNQRGGVGSGSGFQRPNPFGQNYQL